MGIRGRIVPLQNKDEQGGVLRTVHLSIDKDIIVGRGKNTGISDQSISRKQMKLRLQKTPESLALSITPLAKPCKVMRNNETLELQPYITQQIYPNDTFYISRAKVPYQFLVSQSKKHGSPTSIVSRQRVFNFRKNLKEIRSISNSNTAPDLIVDNHNIVNNSSLNESNDNNSTLIEENTGTITELIENEDIKEGDKELPQTKISEKVLEENSTTNFIEIPKRKRLADDPDFNMLINKVTNLENDISIVLSALNSKLNNVVEMVNNKEIQSNSILRKRKRDTLEESNSSNIIIRNDRWIDSMGRIFRWYGEANEAQFGTCYSGVYIDDELYEIGDSVYMVSPVNPPYIGKILAMWEDKSGDKFVQMSWFFYYYDIQHIIGSAAAKKMGVDANDRKIYGSIQTDNNPIVTIFKKIDVKHISELPPGDASSPQNWAAKSSDRYYFDRYFDSRSKKISFGVNIDQLNLVFEYPR